MPHKCTKCEHIFEDGAEVILSGCPNCGWNKFLYVGKNASPEEEEEKEGPLVSEEEVVAEGAEPVSQEKLIKEVDEVLGLPEEKPVAVEEGERVESVRILGPGSYELNLDSLLGRKELVVALKEEGTYALDLPSVFKDKKEKDSD